MKRTYSAMVFALVMGCGDSATSVPDPTPTGVLESVAASDVRRARFMVMGQERIGTVVQRGEIFLWQGDIEVQPLAFVDSDEVWEVNPSQIWASGTVFGVGHALWPQAADGRHHVPFTFDDNVPGARRESIQKALSEWQSATAISFVPRSHQENYMHFVMSEGIGSCSAFMGMPRGKGDIRIGEACTYTGLLHEIGHALGLLHEHTHPARDRYVTVFDENIRSSFLDMIREQFKIARVSFVLPDDHPQFYDLRSVMHYRSMSGSGNGKPTICVNPSLDTPATLVDGACDDAERSELLGTTPQLSEGDVATINWIYPQCLNDICRIFEDDDGDGVSIANDTDDSDPCVPSERAYICVLERTDEDGDGISAARDVNDRDPCWPDPGASGCVPKNPADRDLDGAVGDDDPDDNDPCVPNEAFYRCRQIRARDPNTRTCQPGMRSTRCINEFDGDRDGVLDNVDDDPHDPCVPGQRFLACKQRTDEDEDGTTADKDPDDSDPCLPLATRPHCEDATKGFGDGEDVNSCGEHCDRNKPSTSGGGRPSPTEEGCTWNAGDAGGGRDWWPGMLLLAFLWRRR